MGLKNAVHQELQIRKTREKTMKQAMAAIGIFLLVIMVMMGLGWIVQGNEFFMYKYFAPKQEAVRREVFEQTKSYKQGSIQELQNMQFEYVKADKEHQDALASIILHRAADFPEKDMPTDLQEFIQKLKNEHTGSASTSKY